MPNRPLSNSRPLEARSRVAYALADSRPLELAEVAAAATARGRFDAALSAARAALLDAFALRSTGDDEQAAAYQHPADTAIARIDADPVAHLRYLCPDRYACACPR